MSIKNFKISSLSPDISNIPKKLHYLMPTNIFPEKVQFEIHDVNIGISNAIRRVLPIELSVKALMVEIVDYKTNDGFMLNDYVIKRIRNIPINQKISADAKFELDIVNETASLLHVKAKDFKQVAGKKLQKSPFNDGFIIASLEPGKFMKINNIFIDEGYGYMFAGWSLASGSVCLPLDQTPINLETREGISSSVSNPRNHKIIFDTNGAMDAKEMLVNCCKNIKERLSYVESQVETIIFAENLYLLYINNETDTIGNLLMKTICDDYSSVKHITYDAEPTDRKLTLKITTEDDAKKILYKTIEKLIGIFDKIQKQFL